MKDVHFAFQKHLPRRTVLRGAGAERHRGGMMAAVQDVYPGLPLVGYERGDDLTAMTALGFRPTGALRVWIAPARAP